MATAPATTPSAHTEQVDLSVIENRAASVGHLFRQRATATPDRAAFQYAQGDRWVSLTWAQVRETCYRLAAGLVSLGVEPEDRVGITSGTRVDWALADLAVMCAGAATTTIYPTTIADDVAFILADSGCRVVFAEDETQVAKLREIREHTPEVMRVVSMTGEGDGDWVITMSDLEGLGADLLATNPGVVDDRIDALTPDRLATIIYTSGTTGRPKGVRLLHSSWTYVAAANSSSGDLTEDDLQYLWLPLAHVFGKLLLTLPLQIGFTTAIDGRIDQIVPNLAVVKPTFMGAAPRIFEKAYARINAMMAAEGGVKAKLFSWAIGVGRRVVDLEAEGKPVPALLARQYALADKLVLVKVRERFGGRIRFFVSGSAALNQDIARWFGATGLLIAEGYGMTETSAATTVNRLGANKYGTVGWPLPGTETRIAEDGELLIRGGGVMDGYHNNPEATAEAKDPDGWLHTGDIAEIDAQGYVKITDRKKDMFKTSNGKYVAPAVIESTFKGICPLVGQFIVYGADRNFVSALVTLDPDAVTQFAAASGMAGKPYAEIVASGPVRELVQRDIDSLNAGLNRWEQVKKFTILDHDLSVEGGELTPSLKLRRKVVSERYKDLLDAHYS